MSAHDCLCDRHGYKKRKAEKKIKAELPKPEKAVVKSKPKAKKEGKK